MSKGTVIKDAIKFWEEKTKLNSAEAEVVKLIAMMPPIAKIDPGLNALTKVKQLGLSSNSIDKMCNFNGLQFLTILSLSRNVIKKIEALEPVADTLEELWLSYNQIERVNGIECCKKLKVFYLANNKVKGWDGLDKLRDLPLLQDVLLVGNPLEEKLTSEGQWRDECIKKFPTWKRLDGKPVIRDEEGDGNNAAPKEG